MHIINTEKKIFEQDNYCILDTVTNKKKTTLEGQPEGKHKKMTMVEMVGQCMKM